MKMFTEKRQERLFKLVENYYKVNNFDYLHGIDHVKRVVYWTKIISKEEKVNLSIMIPAAILHDIALAKYGDSLHARKGETFCQSFLRKTNYTKEEIAKIGNIIRLHSTDDPIRKRTLEGNILFDADKMDAVGPIGFVRNIFDKSNKGSEFIQLGENLSGWLSDRRKKYGSLFFTKTGKKLGRGREKYYEKRFKELIDDLNKVKKK